MEEIKLPEFENPEDVIADDYIRLMKGYISAQLFANLLGPLEVVDTKEVNERFIKVTYSGSGDSGGVDSVFPKKYFDFAKVVPYFEYESGYRLVEGNYTPYGRVTLRDRSLEDILISFCYTTLEHYYSGWETDDGAEGYLLINALTGEMKLEHTTYETTTTTDTTVL